MELKLFYEANYKRMRMLAKNFVSLYRLSPNETEDLIHCGFIGAGECLDRFDPLKGNDPFNYCSRNIKRRMIEHVRECHGNKPKSHQVKMIFFLEGMHEELDVYVADRGPCLTAIVDLKRALEKQMLTHEAQTLCFLDSVLNERGGAEYARSLGVTRMCVNEKVTKVRKRLHKELMK